MPEFQQFCTEYLDVIKPEVVLATGDLTDAKHANMMGSEQFEEEWVEYKRVLTESGALHKTVWLDLRGNHGMYLTLRQMYLPVSLYYILYMGYRGNLNLVQDRIYRCVYWNSVYVEFFMY